MDAEQKRTLSKELIVLTALAIEDWTRISADLDFADLRRELAASKEMVDLFTMVGDKDGKLKDRVVNYTVDVFEFISVATPFVSMSMSLCEEAQDILLAESLVHIPQDEPLAEMVRSLWLVSLDAERGRAALEASIRWLNGAVLARVALSQALQTTVVWNTPNRGDQDILLNLADSALQVIDATVDRTKLPDEDVEAT